MKTGIELIAAERERQITAEGWTAQHDDQHREGEMARAAMCYAGHVALQCAVGTTLTPDIAKHCVPRGWPWDAEWWKPSGDNIRDMTKAGALIAAEIDRLQRAQNTHA